MSEYDWDGLRRTVGEACARIASGVERAGVAAVDMLEIQTVERKLSELYERLGRLIYRKLKATEPCPELTQRISSVMAAIDRCEDALALSRAKAEARRAAKPAEKQ